MNKQMQILSAVLIGFIGITASAELVGKRAVTRIDFNKIIDESQAESKDIHKNLNDKNKVEETVSANEPIPSKKNSIDFVDVEVGMGQMPAAIDRRVNSVSAPRVVNLEADSVKVLLVKVKRKGS